MYEQIQLFTRDGQLVTTVTIGKMNPRPEIIQWGSRMFVKKEIHSGGSFTEGYYEGLLVLPVA